MVAIFLVRRKRVIISRKASEYYKSRGNCQLQVALKGRMYKSVRKKQEANTPEKRFFLTAGFVNPEF